MFECSERHGWSPRQAVPISEKQQKGWHDKTIIEFDRGVQMSNADVFSQMMSYFADGDVEGLRTVIGDNVDSLGMGPVDATYGFEALMDGSLVELPSGIQGWRSIGWTSDTQLVYLIDIEDETIIQTLDITTGETQDIATLQSFRGWTLTASGPMC